MRTLIGIIIVVAITLSVSFSMARYQANLEVKMTEFTARITRIPETFGNWTRTKTEPLPEYAATELKVKDAQVWYYTNSQTNEQVSVFVIVGPTGRLGVHTPEICLPGAEVLETTGRAAVVIPTTNAEGETVENKFWKVSFNERLAKNYQRLFYYTMGTGRQWYASENPRFEFSQYPMMVKIQVETVIATSANTEEDLVYRFLNEFIPEVDRAFAGVTL